MPWPKLWSSSTKDERESDSGQPPLASKTVDTVTQSIPTSPSGASEVPSSQFRAFAEPQTVVATLVLTAASLGLYKFYKRYLRRIPQAVNISPELFRRRSILGKVTSVGDGDNFRLYHTPGGRLVGWDWLPGRHVPSEKKALKDNTVSWLSDTAAHLDSNLVRFMSVWRGLMRQS